MVSKQNLTAVLSQHNHFGGRLNGNLLSSHDTSLLGKG